MLIQTVDCVCNVTRMRSIRNYLFKYEEQHEYFTIYDNYLNFL